MAQLHPEKAEIIWHLQRQLLEIINQAKRSVQEIKQEWKLP